MTRINMNTPDRVMLINKDSFTKVWVCQVTKLGFHPAVTCTPSTEHDKEWGCGYRYEFHMSYLEKDFLREWGEPSNA